MCNWNQCYGRYTFLTILMLCQKEKQQTSPNISWKGVGLAVDALRGHVGHGASEGIALQQTRKDDSSSSRQGCTLSALRHGKVADVIPCTNSNGLQMQAREDALPLPGCCLQKR